MSAADQIRFDEPATSLTRLAARFGGHAYDLHRHETYGVGLTLWVRSRSTIAARSRPAAAARSW
jgi:hypothetical protein